jgi:hypothetical protein
MFRRMQYAICSVCSGFELPHAIKQLTSLPTLIGW